MMIALLVWLFKPHHHSFWKLRDSIVDDAKLADIISEVVHEIYLHKAGILFLINMLWNRRLDLSFSSSM